MGEAPSTLPVVCLPGIRGDSRIFEPFAAAAVARPVVLLDLPAGAPAVAAARLRDQLPSGPFHVVTGSFGGLVARFLPASQLVSLACIGTLPSPTHLDPGMARRAHLLMALPDRVLESLYARHSRRSFAQEGLPPALIARLLDRPLAAAVLRGRLRSVLGGHHGHVPACPVMWVHGAHDAQVRWSVEALQRAVPHATVLQTPGAHFPHASHPVALWSALARDSWPRHPGPASALPSQ